MPMVAILLLRSVFTSSHTKTSRITVRISKRCLELLLTTLRWITGPVVRQAPNRLVFNTVTALHGKRPEN